MEVEKVANIFYEDGHIFYLKIEHNFSFFRDVDSSILESSSPLLRHLEYNGYNVTFLNTCSAENLCKKYGFDRRNGTLSSEELPGRFIIVLRLIRNYEKENAYYLIPIRQEYLQF